MSFGRLSGSPNDFAAAAFLASSGSANTTLNDQSDSHSTYFGPKPLKYAYVLIQKGKTPRHILLKKKVHNFDRSVRG